MSHLRKFGWPGAILAFALFAAGFVADLVARSPAQGQAVVRVTAPDPYDTRRIEVLEAQMTKLGDLGQKMDGIGRTMAEMSATLGRIEALLADRTPKRR
jgi:hypothetical protein